MSLKEKKKNNKLIFKFKFNKINKLFYNKLLINKLNNLNENIENIILFGNSGSGKTTIINILKRKYTNNLQLSNFNSKGYDYIMSSINNFIKIKSNEVKIIIFDNLDNISLKAQHIISEILDNDNIKVIISCTNLCNIIESIQSNCILIKLTLEKDILFKHLKIICDKEQIKYSDESINILIETYDYDIRKILNIIDVLNISFNEINELNINKLLNKIDNIKIKKIINNLLDNKLKISIEIVNELLINGYSIDDILLAFIDIINEIIKDEELKINLINIINKKYIIINEVINSNLQLYSCLAEISDFNNKVPR